MRDLTNSNFGIAISYLIPGMVALWGIGAFGPSNIRLDSELAEHATIGGFLFLTLVALGLGMFSATVRWLLIDSLHHTTGIRKGRWDFSRFHEIRPGYDRLTSLHYDYYQWHANSLTSLLFAYPVQRVADTGGYLNVMTDFGVLCVVGILFIASRDTLRKYYRRLDELMQPAQPSGKSHYSLVRAFSMSRHKRLSGISRASATF